MPTSPQRAHAPREPAHTPPEPSLRDLPPEQRPRELLMSEGASRLEPEALIALILSTGRGAGEDALQLARSTLKATGGLRRLSTATAQALCEINGLGPVKAARLVAAFELARRALGGERPSPPSTALTDPINTLAQRARAAWVDDTATVIACQRGDLEGAVTLALDQDLALAAHDPALIGRWLRRLLLEGEGAWTVIACRRGELRDAEGAAVERLFEGAQLLGVHIERALIVNERHHTALTPHGLTPPGLTPPGARSEV
jgi:DNA repair protein RadC